eukprot:3976051-Amphidinium_carterae.1
MYSHFWHGCAGHWCRNARRACSPNITGCKSAIAEARGYHDPKVLSEDDKEEPLPTPHGKAQAGNETRSEPYKTRYFGTSTSRKPTKQGILKPKTYQTRPFWKA